jgi:Mlc titration factor MtfA (ptsG expression regulator)
METTHIVALVGTFVSSSVFSSIITWLLSRKKYKEEVKGSAINNMHSSLDFYEDLSDDARQRLHNLIDENKQLSI